MTEWNHSNTHDGYPDPGEVDIWLDEVPGGGLALYLSGSLDSALADARERGGVWMQLVGIGALYFEYVAFIKGKALFVARHMRPLPSKTTLPDLVPEREWRHFAAPLPTTNEAER